MKQKEAKGVRLRLVIAYDGSGFRGWQSQAGGGTVQDHLEAAFKTLCGTRVPVHGAGRTDAGVHALGQCAHADVTRGDGLDHGAQWESAAGNPRAEVQPGAGGFSRAVLREGEDIHLPDM